MPEWAGCGPSSAVPKWLTAQRTQPRGGAMAIEPAQSRPSPRTTPRTPATTRRAFIAGSGALAAGAVGSTLTGGAALAAGPGGGDAIASDTWPDGPGRMNEAQRASRELRQMINAIDPRRIEAN